MEGAQKYEAGNENVEGWESLKEQAPEVAAAQLAERGLVTNVELATAEEVEKLVAELPALIEVLTYGEQGAIKNEHRYVVRELSVLLNKAEKKSAYVNAPSPALSAA